MTLRPATPADLPSIHDLLSRATLPLAGVDEHLRVVVADEGGRIVGCAGLERYGASVLLRSVAVDAASRGQGLGQRLAAETLAVARRDGAATAFLLTETAATFFPKLGFAPVDRAEVPAEVRQSVEFTSACPASALVMRLALEERHGS